MIKSFEEKMKAIEEIIKTEKKIAEKEGREAKVGRLSDFKITGREHYMLTGILGIDLNTNGYKKGTFNVIYGAESGGKSTIALEVCASIQMNNPEAIILYVDAEQTVDDTFIDRIPYLNKNNIIFIKENIIEHAFNKVIEYCREGVVDAVVIDSIDSLTSIKESEKGLDEAVMMEKARVLSRGLAELGGYIADNQITVIMLQQERVSFSGYIVKTSDRSGGKAMRYYPATVLKISKIASENEKEKDVLVGDKIVTQFVKITNDKSKISEPYKQTHTFINVDRSKKVAVEKRKELIDYAIQYGLINGKGWYEIADQNGELIKVQGTKGLTKVFLENTDLYTITKMRLYALALPPELFIIKFDSIKSLLEKENAFLKKSKIDRATFLNLPEYITEMDKTEFHFEETKPEDFLTEEKFKEGTYNLMSSEEIEKLNNPEMEKENNNNDIEIISVETKGE